MCKLSSSTVVIGLDNQAAIKALRNQETKSAHYLLDQIHTTAEHLQVKQDHIIHKLEFQHAKCNDRPLKARTRGVFDLNIHWVPGHNNFEPNEKANEVAKQVALGKSSPFQNLPVFLHKPAPLSIAALYQESRAKTQRVWLRRWKGSLQYQHVHCINKDTPSCNWLKLVQPLKCNQASIMLQLCTGHIALNKCLHHICCSATAECPNCDENTMESTHHYLFNCSRYHRERSVLHNKLQHNSHELAPLKPPWNHPTTQICSGHG